MGIVSKLAYDGLKGNYRKKNGNGNGSKDKTIFDSINKIESEIQDHNKQSSHYSATLDKMSYLLEKIIDKQEDYRKEVHQYSDKICAQHNEEMKRLNDLIEIIIKRGT